MTHFDQAKTLVAHARQAMQSVRRSYEASLSSQQIDAALLIDVKNVMENLRSALDYTAHGLFSKYGSSPKQKPRIYFPYATLQDAQAAFPARIGACIPGLSASRIDIATRLDTYQHYSALSNKWLPLFMELNNKNKHEKLTPQSRTETRELRIESRDATMSLSGNANATVGPGASISVGRAMIPGTQQFDAYKAPTMIGNGKQTIIIWVSFTFDENGEEVLSFLCNAVARTEQIVNELSVL